MKKELKTLLAVAAITIVMAVPAFAGQTALATGGWSKNATGWWWNNGNGTWPSSTWAWLDGNHDGVSECYYFDANGYMLSGTKTPDGYTVDQNGAWVVNGKVQTKAAASTGTSGVLTSLPDGEYLTAMADANGNFGYEESSPHAYCTTAYYAANTLTVNGNFGLVDSTGTVASLTSTGSYALPCASNLTVVELLEDDEWASSTDVLNRVFSVNNKSYYGYRFIIYVQGGKIVKISLLEG